MTQPSKDTKTPKTFIGLISFKIKQSKVAEGWPCSDTNCWEQAQYDMSIGTLMAEIIVPLCWEHKEVWAMNIARTTTMKTDVH